MVILEVTLYTSQFNSSDTLHRNINPTIISMLVRSVSRMSLVSVPHSLKKTGMAIMAAKLEDYYILRPLTDIRYTSTTISMFPRTNLSTVSLFYVSDMKKANLFDWLYVSVDCSITIRLHRWDIGELSWQMSIPCVHSVQARPVVYGLTIWSMCDVSSSYLCNLQVCRRKEPELYVIWQLRCTIPVVTLPLTISSRRTHWLSYCWDETWHCWVPWGKRK